jgi:hypothetical protein
MSEQAIILADKPTLPVFQISPSALQTRDEALGNSALIAKVENAEQNKLAVEAHIFLKRIASSFEKARKQLKEPLIEAGRQLDRTIAKELADVEKEIGRMEQLTGGFQLQEQRRIREEQEAQRRELERIEAARQAELLRIAREQAEAERIAAAAVAEANRLAHEATSKKQKEAAEAARIEADRVLAETAAKNAAAIQLAQESAQAQTLAEAKPIVAQRTTGQVVKTVWEYEVVNPILFAKMHPDCVQWEKLPVIAAQITQHLNSGMTLKGVTAKQITKATVRAGTAQLIEV